MSTSPSVPPNGKEDDDYFFSLGSEQKFEYLLRAHRETFREFAEHSKKTNHSIEKINQSLLRMNESILRVESILGNQSVVLANQFRGIMGEISNLKEAQGIGAESFGKVSRELADIHRKIEEEKNERKERDLIHEEAITGVDHQIAKTTEKVEKAETALQQVTKQITVTNIAKGTFLGIVATAIEFLIKHIDEVRKALSGP